MKHALTREQMMALLNQQSEAQPAGAGGEDFLAEMKSYLAGGGQILPIVGNSMLDSLVFPFPAAGEGETPRVEEMLAKLWAKDVGYPFASRIHIAQIAQFVLMTKGLALSTAKKRYVDFLKETLIGVGKLLGEEDDFLQALRAKTTLTFPQVAEELELLPKRDDLSHPLAILARLNVPLYITTSYYDFLERALEQAGLDPITHICFWDGPPPPEAADYAPDADFQPDDPGREGFRPVVYHLLGHERFPSSMVLSEDDYLEYLKNIARDSANSQRPILPTYLRDKLANSALVMMGLNMSDWDFRVLFRGVLPLTIDSYRHPCVAIQLDPSQQESLVGEKDALEAARCYLENYFQKSQFKLVLQDTTAFVHELWQLRQQLQEAA